MDPVENPPQIDDMIEQLRAELEFIEHARCRLQVEVDEWEKDPGRVLAEGRRIREAAVFLLDRKKECQDQINLLTYVDPEQ